MENNSTVRVSLSPTAGFCIKSTTLLPAVCRLSTTAQCTNNDALSPQSDGLSISKGPKVFVNIAWDANVPPPPNVSDEIIQYAMAGDDDAGEGWFVPVIVSEPRTDTDKGDASL